MKESDVMRQIQIEASKNGNRLFRNNVALGWVGKAIRPTFAKFMMVLPSDVLVKNARPLHAGLCIGSGDLIGWKRVEITQEMVGETLAVFHSGEVKINDNKPTKEQLDWQIAVQKAGGIAEIIYGD